MTEGIPIYLRLKSDNSSLLINNVKIIDSTNITLNDSKQYEFAKVLTPETSQEQLFQTVGLSLVNNVLDGNDSSIFTMGPSGSGKSYSILGNSDNPGILMQSLKNIFELVDDFNKSMELKLKSQYFYVLKKYYGKNFNFFNHQSSPKIMEINHLNNLPQHYFISLNAFEIYNDNVIDLLDEDTIKKEISVDPKDNRLKPNGINYTCIESLEDAKKLILKAIKKRHVSATEMNSNSSRSHTFIYVNIHQVIVENGKIEIDTSRLNVVDLAGNEKLSKHLNDSQRKEGNVNNVSLSELGRVLQSISELKTPFKPQDRSILRTSKITRLLFHDYMGNESHKMKILVNLDPFANIKIINSVLRIIKPAETIVNQDSIMNISFSPSKTKILHAHTLSKPINQVRVIQNKSSMENLKKKTESGNNPIKLQYSPIKVDSSFRSNESTKVSILRSPSKLIKKSGSNDLNDKIQNLEQRVVFLQNQLMNNNSYIAEMEYSIRQEVAEEYKEIIQNIESNHINLLNKFESNNLQVTDTKLDMLSQEMKIEIDKLRKDNEDLLKDNSLAVTNYEQLLFKHQMDVKSLMNLEEQINNFNNDNIRLNYENKKLVEEVEFLKNQLSNQNSKPSMRKSYAIELDQLRNSFLEEHEKTVKEYQSKIAILSDKLRIKTEKNRLLVEKLQRSNSNSKEIQFKKDEVKRLSMIKKNILRESLDNNSFNIMQNKKKNNSPVKKKAKKALKKPKSFAMIETSQSF